MIPAFAVGEYRRALPFLNILSENSRIVERGEVDDRLVVLEDRLKEMDRKYAMLKRFDLKDVDVQEE